MKRLTLIMLLVLVLGISGQAGATELVGPKAFAMGGAFTAVADDASSFYWNPAGLTRSGFIGAELSLGLSSSSITDIYNVVKTLDEGNVVDIVNLITSTQDFNGRITGFLGANVKNFSGGIIVNEDINFTYNDFEGYGYRYSEKIGNIGMGVDLTKPIFNLGRISLGANVKIIQRDEYKYKYDPVTQVFTELDPENPVVVDQELGLDLGSLLRITNMVNVALVARNMKMTLQEDGESCLGVQLPESLTLGAAVKLPFPLSATVAADLEYFLPTTDELGNEVESTEILHVGLEKGFLLNAISLRAGAYGPFKTSDRMFKDKITFTTGLGVNVAVLHADAALGVSNDFQDYHGTLSASFKF